MKVAVVGGGITGVSAARFLLDRGHAPTVFEATARIGGLCGSDVVDGFVVDHAGGHILYSVDKEVLDFLLGALGPDGAVRSERRTRIFHRGRYVSYPFENGLGDLAPADNFECLKGYVEAAFARRAGAPEPADFHAWCLWRFGEGICRQFMHPYNEKIWNVDLRRLGVAWVRGRVPDAPIDDVLRAAVGLKTTGYAHQAIFWYPKQGGFEAIVHAVARTLPEGVIRLSTPVRRVERAGGRWSVDGESFDHVLSTAPLTLLPAFAPEMPASVRAACEGLTYTSLLTVFVALKHDRLPDYSWVYFPHPENGPQNRITYLSNYAPANAPPGCGSVMAEVTYLGPRPDPDRTAKEVVEGLVRCGVFAADDVLFTRTYDNRFAYVLYEHGLEERVATVRAWAQSIGLGLAGRFGNYNYYNSDRCVRAALDAAEALGRA
ncbi:MAG TPA: FAD-dependent oxidoreductase [Planctomycetota bacterium]|nr:FAD-dependent oxidoreductase [Planctomycetota bacterium]